MFTTNNMVIWNADTQKGKVRNSKGNAGLIVKPNVPNLEYDSLYAEPLRSVKVSNGEFIELTEEEVAEVDNWIKSYAIYGVNANNVFIGGASYGDYVAEANSAPPLTANGEVWTWDSNTGWTDSRTEQEKLNYYVPKKIAEVWAEANTGIQNDTVFVDITDEANTTTSYGFGVDDDTRKNIETVLFGIILNMTPNPRYWTPKGESSPILVTHDDLKTVAGTVGARYDAWMQAYLTHKSNILALSNTEAVINYDYSLGWPSDPE